MALALLADRPAGGVVDWSRVLRKPYRERREFERNVSDPLGVSKVQSEGAYARPERPGSGGRVESGRSANGELALSLLDPVPFHLRSAE